jgi:predicted hydrocarbon binding protein
MAITRKEFFRNACMAGACFCGFTSLGMKAVASETTTNEAQPDDGKLKMMQDWISTLLLQIDENAGDEECRKIMKPCAMAHYNYLEMDKVLEPYVGNMAKFIQFINNEWSWKIEYNAETGVIIADENKSYCVCPMVNKEKGVRSSILCYCSEGFAEKMFSTVAGHPVKARVISSIHRGNDRCKYEIRVS